MLFHHQPIHRTRGRIYLSRSCRALDINYTLYGRVSNSRSQIHENIGEIPLRVAVRGTAGFKAIRNLETFSLQLQEFGSYWDRKTIWAESWSPISWDIFFWLSRIFIQPHYIGRHWILSYIQKFRRVYTYLSYFDLFAAPGVVPTLILRFDFAGYSRFFNQRTKNKYNQSHSRKFSR